VARHQLSERGSSRRIRVCSITVAQKASGSVTNIEANVADAVASARRLKSSELDLLCLPEGFLYTGMGRRQASSVALGPDSGIVQAFTELAKECGTYLAVPMLERADTGEVHNAVLLFNRDGSRIGTYCKRMLWPSKPDFSELENGVTPGAGGGPFPTELGAIGIQTCLEVQWPSTWRALNQQGAKLILFPSEQSGGVILRHRAWDARCFVLSAVSKGGPSQAIDPLGNVLAEWWPETSHPMLDLFLDFELVHLDYNEDKLQRLATTLNGRVKFAFHEAERLCVVTSLESSLQTSHLLAENGILTLDHYLQKIVAINAADGSS